MDLNPDEEFGGEIPTRPMRVKVLYSFDQENRTNCLARFPNTLQIPVVVIDEGSQVGVIELQQCIHIVTAASPELVTRLSDGDFTVYAYDYSEADTPLVGQGMLSAAVSGVTSSEKVMITGRVCKNIPAIFSNGVKETLEVKLRLTPVPKPAILTAVVKSMSPATSAGFDPNAWNSSMQQSRLQQQQESYFDYTPDGTMSEGDMALVDEMLGLEPGSSGAGSGQRLMGGVGMAQTPTDPAFGFNPAFSHSAPGSRAGSPMMGLDSSSHNEQVRHQSFSVNTRTFADQSRPASRASLRSEVQPSRHQRQSSTHSLPPQQMLLNNEVYYNEDGQSRKRAKVTQADWRGRSSFGAKSGDLRVTAATAHSVHMHRPIAKRPAAPGTDLEPPPRVPTPVPQMNPMMQRPRMPQAQQSRSFLRQASTMTADSDFLSDAEQYSDAMMSSPEDDSPNTSVNAEGTPPDIPSSPPVLMGGTYPQPSSPGLPTLPFTRMADSGYMSERGLYSGAAVETFDDDDEDRSPDAEDLEIAAQYRARVPQPPPFPRSEAAGPGLPTTYPLVALPSDMNVNLETPGDMGQLPQKMLINMPPGRYRQSSQGPKQPKPANGKKADRVPATPVYEDQSLGTDGAASTRGSLALPPNPRSSLPPAHGQASDQAGGQRPAPKRRNTKRPLADTLGSEAGSPAPSDNENQPRGPKRSGSGAQRRVIIKQRLEAALARNEMPQFCNHCGSIETPTWRKLYVKKVDGKPTPLDEHEGEGETIGVEAIEWDAESSDVTRFLIRKSMKKTKDSTPGEGFEDVTVCNPCGLWFNKFRSMRPQEKWNRKTTSRRSKKQRTAAGEPLMTDGMEPPSEAFFTDQIVPEDAMESEETATDPQLEGLAAEQPQPKLPINRPRASSLQPQPRRRGSDGLNASQLDAALARAVQSSPVPFRGSQASPIEVDEMTPRPTRRLLFPSPRRNGKVKSLDDNGQASLNATPPSGKGSTSKLSSSLKAAFAVGDADVNVFDAFTVDKENLEPGLELDDDLMHLFQGSPTAVFKTPSKTPSKTATTPRASQRQLDHLLKTPTPTSRKRKPLSPNPNAANNGTVNDFLTSPSSSRYFLRSTPSRQDRTPGRASQASGGNEMTPFSRHLAQMLSDAEVTAAFTSPSRALDFSDLPTFTTPGKDHLSNMDWMNDMLSSEFGAFDDLASAGAGMEGAE